MLFNPAAPCIQYLTASKQTKLVSPVTGAKSQGAMAGIYQSRFCILQGQIILIEV